MAKPDEVMLGFPGVYVAVLVYPVACFLVAIVAWPFTGFGFFEFLNFAFGVLAAGILGLLVAGPVGLVCFGLAISLDYALGNVISSRNACIAAGGMTGFVCTAGPWIWFEPWIALFAIPGIALGQCFVARFFDDNSGIDLSSCRPDWWRYDILQMMKTTAWIAILFAIARLVPQGMILLGAGSITWFALHILILYAGKGLFRLFKIARSR